MLTMEHQTEYPNYEPILTGTNVDNTELVPAPSDSANAAEVRGFIVNVLVKQYSVDKQLAHEIAQLWTVGSGQELQKFPARLFIEIFGEQAGWVLYKEVSIRAIQEKVKTMAVFDYRNRRMLVQISD